MRKHSVGDVTYCGEFADTFTSITEEEWAYYSFADSISDQIAEYMGVHGISKSALASKMGTSKAFISKVLSGDANLTIKTISKILFAIGAKPEVKVVDRDNQVKWFGIISQKDRSITSTAQNSNFACALLREDSRAGTAADLLTAA